MWSPPWWPGLAFPDYSLSLSPISLSASTSSKPFLNWEREVKGTPCSVLKNDFLLQRFSAWISLGPEQEHCQATTFRVYHPLIELKNRKKTSQISLIHNKNYKQFALTLNAGCLIQHWKQGPMLSCSKAVEKINVLILAALRRRVSQIGLPETDVCLKHVVCFGYCLLACQSIYKVT